MAKRVGKYKIGNKEDALSALTGGVVQGILSYDDADNGIKWTDKNHGYSDSNAITANGYRTTWSTLLQEEIGTYASGSITAKTTWVISNNVVAADSVVVCNPISANSIIDSGSNMHVFNVRAGQYSVGVSFSSASIGIGDVDNAPLSASCIVL